MNKKILITNDDGVYAAGILAAYKSVCDLGNVTISAPSIQQSGVGRSMSIFEPLRIAPTKLNGNISAYAISGTPADSVILGIFAIMKEMPDLVISGFNMGENISTDTINISGTIGAAMEAASYGIPSIAVSIQATDDGMKFDDMRDFEHDYEVGIKVINKIAKNILAHGLPDTVDFLNINIPIHVDDNPDIEITSLSRKKIYYTNVETRHDPRGRPYYWIVGDFIKSDTDGTDVYALLEKKVISVTPVSLDPTALVKSSIIKKLL